MKQSTFLIINGVGYMILGLLCAIAPGWTAELVGFALTGTKGLAEYVAVYGGLEFGIGIFFLICCSAGLQRAGTIFALCLYGGLVGFRSSAMLFYRSPTTDIGWALFGLEVTFLFLSVAVYRRGSGPAVA